MEATKKVIELPELIPVLPVRNTVLFPNASVPLMVGRARSVKTVREAQKHGDLLLVLTQKDGATENPTPADLNKVGVICLLSKVHQVEKESFQLIANGLFRFEVTEFVEANGFLSAKGIQIVEVSNTSPRTQTLADEVKKLGNTILSLANISGAEALGKALNQIESAGQVADLCAAFLPLPIAAKQELVELRDVEARLARLLELMSQEKERLVVQNEIQGKMMERISKDQRDHLLREQIKTLHDELGDEVNVPDEYAKKIEAADMPPEAKKIALEELGRLKAIQRASPEYHVIRTYLDWLVALPWTKTSGLDPGSIDLEAARKVLDEDHYGIEKVKNRILQFLAVTKLKKDTKGPILCLVGPPGVGKTSIAKSIAKALGREFVRTSLGGVRDEAEIRGHRRTYIGALPGRLVQSMKRAAVKDPVILLDEVDKIGLDFRGDPASALLEVLDPEQNNTFTDHYIDTPFDLSRVFFITTANMLDTIPPALRDRLEVIEMASYSKDEKLKIARTHLLPKVLVEHGIKPEQFEVSDQVLTQVIEWYTREAGVRNLTRELAHLCRAAAEKLAGNHPPEIVRIVESDLENILGTQKYFIETVEEGRKPGVVTGLAWTPVGGDILQIEVTRMEGRGNLILTGQLGDVMKESAQIALSLVRSQLGRNLPFRFERTDFHIHVPSGAIPKDGPSAGTAIFLALASLVEGKSISTKLALTGEITLRGAVLPVGGIKEKVMAAHRAGIDTILMPERNQGDLRDLQPDVKSQLKFHFIRDISQVLSLAGLSDLGFAALPGIQKPGTRPGGTPDVPIVTN